MLLDKRTSIYAAPEMFLGQPWNELVDIWGCGITLYFMSIGRPAFDARKPFVGDAFAAGLRGL